MAHKLMTRKFTLPKQSSVDSLTELFRAAISQKGSVQKVLFTVDPPELAVDLFVPDDSLPFGEPHEADPDSVWEALAAVELEEVAGPHPSLNLEAVGALTTLMLKASARKMSGVAWAVGDVTTFLRWIGVRAKNDVPDTFWNLPLIELPELQKGALVLLCARSARLGVLRSEIGFLTNVKETEDAG